MNSLFDLVEIPEYSQASISASKFNEDKDLPYLKKFSYNKNRQVFSIWRSLSGTSIELKNTSYAGILQLDKLRIHFSTKVKTNLFYMLSYLKREDRFFYDSEKIIDMKEGANFFDILGRLYLNEFKSIIQRGIYKKYVRKSENVRYLKGKLLLEESLMNDVHKNLEFFCAYDDLTYDNLENQIILRAATLLVPLIRFSDDIKRDLIIHSNAFRTLVNLVNIVPDDCDKIQYCRLNEYYEQIIKFSKVILQNYFIKSIYPGAARGFNFLVNMNDVYEDFLTEIIKEVVSESEEFKDFIVEPQEKFSGLVRERKIITKPDIILRNKITNEYSLIVDAKYKTQPSNYDYYQVIAYALAILSAKACCLVYPEGEPIENPVLTLDTSPYTTPGREVKLYSTSVGLHLDEFGDDTSFKTYISKIKKQIRSKLAYYLNLQYET